MNNYPNEQQEARKVVNNAAGLNAFFNKNVWLDEFSSFSFSCNSFSG